MRPGQEAVQAFKSAMRGSQPTDAWRPPKPSAQGAPGGERGGRGGGISGYLNQSMGLESEMQAADQRLAEAEEAIKAHTASPGLSHMIEAGEVVGKEAFSTHGMSLKEARDAEREAHARKKEISDKQATLQKSGGSQADRRVLEEMLRQQGQADREKERELKKYDTKPNHDIWLFGDSTMKESRAIRGQANENQAAAGRLGGHADPKAIQAAKKASKAAKLAAKAAKKAGKNAKDAAKYGTKDEAFRAAVRAKTLAEEARKALGEADKKLKAAEASSTPVPIVPPDGGPGGSYAGPGDRTPVATVPDNAHMCGDPNPGCDDVELDCSIWPGTRRVCRYDLVLEGGGGADDGDGGTGGGSKGKGVDGPGDTKGSTSDANPTSSPQPHRPPTKPTSGATEGPEGQKVVPEESGASPVPLANGLPEATEEMLEARAADAVEKLVKERERIDKEILALTIEGLVIRERHKEWLAEWGRRAKIKIDEDWLSKWEQKALLRVEVGLSILTYARSRLTTMIQESYVELELGLRSRGQEREDHLVSISRRGWKGPEDVRAEKNEGQAVLDAQLPAEEFKPEELFQDWYGGLEHLDQVRAFDKLQVAGRSDLNRATRDYAAMVAKDAALMVAGGLVVKYGAAGAAWAFKALKAAGKLPGWLGAAASEGTAGAEGVLSVTRSARLAEELQNTRALAKIRVSVQGGEDLLQRTGRFFVDTRKWKSISRAYHKANPGEYDLMHVFFDRRASATWLPESIKNAGWNVLKMPDSFLSAYLRTPTGKAVNLNQWINLVKRSSQYSTGAKVGAFSLEWGVRGLVAVPAGEVAYIGKVAGDTYVWGDE